MEPEVALSLKTGTIRLYGITYTLEVFRALAGRLAPGTQVEIMTRGDGTVTLYHHRPDGQS